MTAPAADRDDDPATPEAVREWLDTAYSAKHWPLAYALAWATFGTLEPLAPYAIRGRDLLGSDPLNGGFTTLITTLNGIAADEFAFARPSPMRAFRTALEDDELKARGCRRNAGEAVKISSADWRALALGAPMGGTGPAAYFEREAAKPETYWTSLVFERAEVQATFEAAPIPRCNPTPTREQELWVQRLLVKSQWTYAEALLWVIYRNAYRVGASLRYGLSRLATDPEHYVQAVCWLIAREDADAVELEPVAALEVALIAGKVESAADFPDRSNRTRPWVLDRAEWQYLTFRGGLGLPGGAGLVDERTWRGYGSSDGVFINVRFLSETVMSAFPADDLAPTAATLEPPETSRRRRRVGGPKMLGLPTIPVPEAWGDASARWGRLAAPEPEPQPETPSMDALPVAASHVPPPPRLGRSARAYVVADDVCAASVARVTARGADAENEAELRAELRAMLTELRWTVEPGSVDAIRRGKGFKVRPRD